MTVATTVKVIQLKETAFAALLTLLLLTVGLGVEVAPAEGLATEAVVLKEALKRREVNSVLVFEKIRFTWYRSSHY
jgi:hypothetical protein